MLPVRAFDLPFSLITVNATEDMARVTTGHEAAVGPVPGHDPATGTIVAVAGPTRPAMGTIGGAMGDTPPVIGTIVGGTVATDATLPGTDVRTGTVVTTVRGRETERTGHPLTPDVAPTTRDGTRGEMSVVMVADAMSEGATVSTDARGTRTGLTPSMMTEGQGVRTGRVIGEEEIARQAMAIKVDTRIAEDQSQEGQVSIRQNS